MIKTKTKATNENQDNHKYTLYGNKGMVQVIHKIHKLFKHVCSPIANSDWLLERAHDFKSF